MVTPEPGGHTDGRLVSALASGGQVSDSGLPIEASPLVSVVMGAYNCAPTLADALESIATQTYRNWELVVCDDASTDGTAAILDAFAKSHPGRVTVLRNDVNRKLAFSLNRCLAVARGDLVARMDGDDRCLPGRLERQCTFLSSHPEYAVVGTAMQRFDDSGLRDVLSLPSRPDRWSMRRDVPFAHATVLVRKQAFDALGGYTVSARTERCEDMDLWFRFLRAGYLGANLGEPLYLVREDLAAIRRRQLRTRYNTFRTSMVGYRLLGYPLRWYPGLVVAFAKVLIPSRGVLAYRRWQARTDRGGA
jgi:glycosyltransferase EpsE